MSKAIEQLLHKQDGSICNNINASENAEVFLAYTVGTHSGASASHLLRPSKRLSPSVNHGPGWLIKKLRIDELEA